MTAIAQPPRILYRATKNRNGSLTVHDVPIFIECERPVGKGEDRRIVPFGADWIEQAVENARAAIADGYEPPLHVLHHAGDNKVRAAGWFRVTGARPMRHRGEQRLAIFADLVITDPAVAAEVVNGRLPYRSVEIHDTNRPPSIDSLALLDHDVPFHKLANLRVEVVENDVSPETVHHGAGPTVAASFEHGSAVALLFQMADDDQKPEPKPDQPPAGESKPEQKPEPEAKPEKTGEPDVDAIVKAIADGSISVAGLQAIVAAVQQRATAGPGGPGQEQGADGKPVAAAAPAPTQMQANPMTDTKPTTTPAQTTPPAVPVSPPAHEAAVQMAAERVESAVQFAQMRAEIASLNGKLKAQEDDRQREADIGKAMKRLEGRPLGSLDALRAELENLHRLSPVAFNAYVDRVEKSIGPAPALGADGVTFAANSNKRVPPIAMQFQAQGADAVEAAANFAAEWDRQRGLGLSQTQEKYVEVHMARRARQLATA